jgi:hypothetical protein
MIKKSDHCSVCQLKTIISLTAKKPLNNPAGSTHLGSPNFRQAVRTRRPASRHKTTPNALANPNTSHHNACGRPDP